ncbi:hypothetical protein ABN028_32965 [Actinopolymorpha sp. B17G11]
MSMRTRPEGPAATPGMASGLVCHQRVMVAGFVVAARTPWHHLPAGRHGHCSIGWDVLAARHAGQLRNGRRLVGQGEDLPVEVGQIQRKTQTRLVLGAGGGGVSLGGFGDPAGGGW